LLTLLRYVCGTDQHILKWKPPKENTVDFRLRLGKFPTETDENGDTFENFDGKPDFELLVFHGDRTGAADYRHFGMLHLEDQEWEAMKGMQQMFDWRIMECWRDSETGKWRPKIEKDGTPRFRDDKEHANFHDVVKNVMESIEDAVSKEELIAAAGRIKVAWKEREKAAAAKKKAAENTDGPGYAD
jgi:mRNA guanylyltransferase